MKYQPKHVVVTADLYSHEYNPQPGQWLYVADVDETVRWVGRYGGDFPVWASGRQASPEQFPLVRAIFMSSE